MRNTDPPPRTGDARGGRWTAIAAVATVLLLVVVQVLAGGPGGGRHGGAIEGLMGEGRWFEAAQQCRIFLRQHPLERRAHLYMNRCLLETDLSQLALQHLVLAATPLGPDSVSPLLPAPGREEIAAALEELESRYPKTMASAWGRLRGARLAASAGDWEGFEGGVRAAVGSGEVAGKVSFGGAGRLFLAAALGVSRDRLEGLSLPDEAVDRLLGFVGAGNFSAAELGASGDAVVFPAGVLAGGAYSGGVHRLGMGSSASSYAAEGGWLFLALDPRDASVLDETRLDLTPLTDEGASLRSWSASLPAEAVVVGLASGEATAATSQEGRQALGEVFDLRRVPDPVSAVPYAFVAYRPEGGAFRVAETRGAATDLPAMLICGDCRP